MSYGAALYLVVATALATACVLAIATYLLL